METFTRRINDSVTTAVCNTLAERAVFQRLAEAIMPIVPSRKTKIVQLAEARAAAFAAGASTGAVGAAVDARTEDTPAAETAVVRCADRRAAEFAAGKNTPAKSPKEKGS